MITTEDCAKHLWTYDDGHDYHYVFTDGHKQPTVVELYRKYGALTYRWILISNSEMGE